MPVSEKQVHAADHADDRELWGVSPAFLKVAIACIFVAAIAAEVVLHMVAPEQKVRAAVGAIIVLVAGVVWILLARNNIKVAIATFGVGLWAYATLASMLYGGVAGVSIIIYPLTIILAGWLLGARAVLAVALVTMLVTLGFVIGEMSGLMSAAPTTHPVIRWIIQSSIFIVTAALIATVARSYSERLMEVRRLSGDLAQRTAELQVIEADLNRAQAVAHVGSWIYDLATDKMQLSRETCQIFGMPSGRAGSYCSYLSRVLSVDRVAVETAWQDALNGGAPFDNEHRIKFGDTFRWVRQKAALEFDASGTPMRAVGTTQDITERKLAEVARDELEAQLRESQKMEALGTLAGGIAHDFNNVLATVMGNLSLAREDIGPNHLARQSLDEIGKAGNRAQALVRQILAFGRRQVLERKPISLAPVLEESVHLLRATQPAGVTINLACTADAPSVFADASQIEQVVVNLCINAWDAIAEHAEYSQPGIIDIRLTLYTVHPDIPHQPLATFAYGRLQAGRYACLSVSDNGSGMGDTVQRRVFEPFFTTKAVGKGTGLGLAVVHGILQGHEAVIELQSAPGAGATFRIYFPATEVAAPELSVDAPRDARIELDEPPPQQPREKHILYVDDDALILSLMTRVLRRQGYRISGYTDPNEAVAAFSANPGHFDLAVTDYNMPGLSGMDVVRQLKSLRADLPIALASGYLTEDLRVEALAAGVREVIHKTSSVDDFCEAVARLAG